MAAGTLIALLTLAAAQRAGGRWGRHGGVEIELRSGAAVLSWPEQSCSGTMDMHVLTRILRERRESIGLVVDLVLLMIGWTGIVATLALLIMTLLLAVNAG